MSIQKTIELITTMKHVCRGLFPPDEQAALSLGIEALKLYDHNRKIGQHVDPILLPGETPSDTTDIAFRHSTSNHRLKRSQQ